MEVTKYLRHYFNSLSKDELANGIHAVRTYVDSYEKKRGKNDVNEIE